MRTPIEYNVMIIQFSPPITEVGTIQAIEAVIFDGLYLSISILVSLPHRTVPIDVLFLFQIVAHLEGPIKEACKLVIAIWALLGLSCRLFVVFLNLVSFFKIIKVLR